MTKRHIFNLFREKIMPTKKQKAPIQDPIKAPIDSPLNPSELINNSKPLSPLDLGLSKFNSKDYPGFRMSKKNYSSNNDSSSDTDNHAPTDKRTPKIKK